MAPTRNSANAAQSLLELRNVSFAYAGSVVVKSVSLSFQRGDFVGLLGPNGSGKSTLLKLLCGLLTPASGDVLLAGVSLGMLRARDIARRVAFMPQEQRADFPFTVSERVLMGRHPHLGLLEFESAKDVEVAREAMRLTDTLQFARRTFAEISGGERQRAALAAALAQEPEILLLDEPTTALDIKFQVQILSLLKRLNQEKQLTVVMAIHDLNLAAVSCQRLVLLKNGEKKWEGSPSEVLTEDRLREIYEIGIREIRDEHGNPVALMPEGI
jgi:iron complex transport system ATP-binding protein